jgi:hypothetical protein
VTTSDWSHAKRLCHYPSHVEVPTEKK